MKIISRLARKESALTLVEELLEDIIGLLARERAIAEFGFSALQSIMQCGDDILAAIITHGGAVQLRRLAQTSRDPTYVLSVMDLLRDAAAKPGVHAAVFSELGVDTRLTIRPDAYERNVVLGMFFLLPSSEEDSAKLSFLAANGLVAIIGQCLESESATLRMTGAQAIQQLLVERFVPLSHRCLQLQPATRQRSHNKTKSTM